MQVDDVLVELALAVLGPRARQDDLDVVEQPLLGDGNLQVQALHRHPALEQLVKPDAEAGLPPARSRGAREVALPVGRDRLAVQVLGCVDLHMVAHGGRDEVGVGASNRGGEQPRCEAFDVGARGALVKELGDGRALLQVCLVVPEGKPVELELCSTQPTHACGRERGGAGGGGAVASACSGGRGGGGSGVGECVSRAGLAGGRRTGASGEPESRGGGGCSSWVRSAAAWGWHNRMATVTGFVPRCVMPCARMAAWTLPLCMPATSSLAHCCTFSRLWRLTSGTIPSFLACWVARLDRRGPPTMVDGGVRGRPTVRGAREEALNPGGKAKTTGVCCAIDSTQGPGDYVITGLKVVGCSECCANGCKTKLFGSATT